MWKGRRRLSQGKTWSCDECGSKFSNHATLKIHSRSHTGKSPYTCHICNSSFLVSSSLKLHVKTQHDSVQPDKSKANCFKCDLCCRLFAKQEKIISHLKQFHRIHNKDVCNVYISSTMATNSELEGGLSPGSPSCLPQEDNERETLGSISPDREADDYEVSSPAINMESSSQLESVTVPSSPEDDNLEDTTGPCEVDKSGSESDSDDVKETEAVEVFAVRPSSSDLFSHISENTEDESDDIPLESTVCQDADSREKTCDGEVEDSESQAIDMSIKTKSITSTDVAHPESGEESSPWKHDEDPASEWTVKKEIRSSCSESNSDISEREWEILNQAYSKSQTEAQHTVARSDDKEDSSFGMFESEDDGPEQSEGEDLSHPKDAEDRSSDNDEQVKPIFDDPSFRNTGFYAAKTPKQFAEMMNWTTQPPTFCYDPEQFSLSSATQEDVQQFWKSWTMETSKTASRRVSRKKNTATKIFNWKSSTSVSPKKKPLLKCSICSGRFADEESLQDHMRRHEGTQTNFLKCDQCPKVFKSKYALHMHERIHSDFRPFHCKVCGKGFYQRANIKVHMRSHTGERPYKCNICGKAYSVKISLAAHSGSHAEENKFACTKCKFCFATEEELEVHQKVHAIQKTHECHRCKKTFLKAYLLEFHLQRDCQDKKYICEYCNKQFSCLDYLKVHQRVHTGEKPYGCEICGKFFSQSANLAKHMKIHNNIRQFSCDICDAAFIEKASMIAHRRIHTGEKPHMCDVCGAAFSSPSSLVVHLRVHTGERPYPCNMCEKRFSSSGKLRDHYRTHTGEKPYKCTMCDKSFALSNGLVRHTRIHTGERPHKCNVCGQRFMRKDRLTKHLSIHLDNNVQQVHPEHLWTL